MSGRVSDIGARGVCRRCIGGLPECCHKYVFTDIYSSGYVCLVIIETLSALAEPHRLQIVELLRIGPSPVAEICARVPLGQPQVSKHLSVLRNAGLVHVRPQGQQRFYALRASPLRELDEWLERFRDIWGARFDQLDQLLLEMKKEKIK
jgi:DNA-binding transcriptional ArsR family regulator